MISPKVFPSLIIVLNLLAAATYACHGTEWRKVIYWLAAATLTTVVTF